MKNKIFERISAVFHSLDESGILPLPKELSEETVLMGDGAVLDSVAFVNFFVGLEEEIGELAGKEILLSLEDIQESNRMDHLDIRELVSFIEEKYFGGADGSR